nr:MAG TPA: hypothetical protein [Caudoviricetes sp.]
MFRVCSGVCCRKNLVNPRLSGLRNIDYILFLYKYFFIVNREK